MFEFDLFGSSVVVIWCTDVHVTISLYVIPSLRFHRAFSFLITPQKEKKGKRGFCLCCLYHDDDISFVISCTFLSIICCILLNPCILSQFFKSLNVTADQKKIFKKAFHVYYDAVAEVLHAEHAVSPVTTPPLFCKILSVFPLSFCFLFFQSCALKTTKCWVKMYYESRSH